MLIRMKDCMGALDMNHGEIKRFHDLVSSIDVNHDDHVSRKEFVDTLDLKPKPMARRLFEVMVVEHTGQEHKKGGSGENTQPLHVAEFFVGIFHFGTRTDKHVHEDFFNIYCTHSISHHGKTRKVMDNTDLHNMIRDIMGEAYLKEHEAKLKKLFKHDGEGTDEVTQDAGMETVGTLDYAGFKDNAKHIYGDTKKVVHDFRKDMEEKTMGPIFGSLAKWSNVRKPEVLKILEDRGFKSVGGLFLKGLNENKKSHNNAADTDFDATKGGTDVHGDAVKRSHSKKGVGEGGHSELKKQKTEKMTAQEKHEHHEHHEHHGKGDKGEGSIRKQHSEKSGHHKRKSEKQHKH